MTRGVIRACRPGLLGGVMALGLLYIDSRTGMALGLPSTVALAPQIVIGAIVLGITLIHRDGGRVYRTLRGRASGEPWPTMASLVPRSDKVARVKSAAGGVV